MQAYEATTTLASTGTAVLVLTPGFQAKCALIKIGSLTAGETVVRFSEGWADGTRQSCDAVFSDGTVFYSQKFTDRIISLWGNVGGVATELIKAANPTFTATQFKMDVTTVNVNYKSSILLLG